MLKRYPELQMFLSTSIAEAGEEGEADAIAAFRGAVPSARLLAVSAQLQRLIADADLSLEELGTEANRWFGDLEEARAWLESLLKSLQNDDAANAQSTIVVKDCNGTPLQEGDAVLVIKDLKVKGGSSDLKRGTAIRKIHLIDDPEAVECRVGGSTLVLKTCFLKKA